MPTPRLFGLPSPKNRKVSKKKHGRVTRAIVSKHLDPADKDEPESGAWGSSPIDIYFDDQLDTEDR